MQTPRFFRENSKRCFSILVIYFKKETPVSELKITIKFNVSFRTMALKYTLSLTMSAL